MLQFLFFRFKNYVEIVNDTTVKQELQQCNISFMYVTTPDSKEFDQVNPIFEILARKYKEDCRFLILDNENSPNFMKKHDLALSDAFYIFEKTKFIREFPSFKDIHVINEYLKQVVGNVVVDLAHDQDAFDFIRKNDFTVILCYNSTENEEIYEKYIEYAKKYTYFARFAVASNELTLKILKPEYTPVIQLRRNIDEYFGILDVDDINELPDYILDLINPKYNSYNAITVRDIRKDNRLTLIGFYDHLFKSALRVIHQYLTGFSNHFNTNLTYMYIDIRKAKYIAQRMGLDIHNTPRFVLANFTANNIIPFAIYPENTTMEAIIQSIDDFLLKYNAYSVRSEPVDNTSFLNLRKLVGSTFKEAISDTNNDVVILFSCGKDSLIRKAMSYMHTISQDFYKQKCLGFKFYYIDITKNDTPGFDKLNQREPQFIIIPAGQKREYFSIQNWKSENIGYISKLLSRRGSSKCILDSYEKYDL